MNLNLVQLTTTAHQCLVTQALTTEGEEVVCLLLGEFKDNGNDNEVHDSSSDCFRPSSSSCCVVHCVEFVVRRDKQKDRVEVSPEQLSSGE